MERQAWQVFARYVLNDSPSWTEPVALLLMSSAMMFGAAVGVRNEAHFGFFLLVHIASAPVRKVLVGIARLIIIAIGLLLAYWGGVLLADGWDIRMAGAPLPQGLYFLPICVGGALIPQMVSRGFDRDFAVSVTVSSAIVALLIPPSHCARASVDRGVDGYRCGDGPSSSLCN